MEQIPDGKEGRNSRLACYIRLTDKEYSRLQSDAHLTGKSVQYLFKNAYFNGGPVVLLMRDEDRDRFMSQLHKIGNNVNQIAKHLNSGFAFGFQDELESIRSQITLMMTWLTAKYRDYKIDRK